MKKISSLLCLGLFLTLSVSCDNTNKNSISDNLIEPTKFIEKSNSNDEYTQIYRNSLQNIILCDNRIVLPCKVKDFNDDFEISTGVPIDGYNETSFTLFYKGIEVGYIIIENTDSIDNANVIGLFIYRLNKTENLINTFFSINSIDFDSTKEECIDYFKARNDGSNKTIRLDIDEKHCIGMFFGDDNKMNSVEIYCKE